MKNLDMKEQIEYIMDFVWKELMEYDSVLGENHPYTLDSGQELTIKDLIKAYEVADNLLKKAVIIVSLKDK